jgi:RNA polymerase sigma-70 factor (ECF subfamily)
MMALPSDDFLMAAFTKGDRSSFDRLVSRYSAVLDGYFRRRLPDDGRAEELRQETLLAIFSLAPSYREQGRFRSLLFSVAYRKLVSARRAWKPAEPISENLTGPAQQDLEGFSVRAALEALPEPLREALMLTYFEGLTSTEAGEVLGCSGDAVRARVCRARTALARRLNEKRRPG